MRNPFTSARRIALLFLILIAGVSFVAVVLRNVTEQQVVTAVLAMMSGLVASVGTFYFSRPKGSEESSDTDTEKK